MNTDILVLFLTLGGKLSVFHHLIRCEFFINTLYHVEELAFYFYLSECFYHKKVLCECCHFSRVQVFVTPWTIARQAPVSMEFSRQEYWSGLPCPAPGDLPNPGTKPTSLTSPALAGGFFTIWATWEALDFVKCFFCVNWDDRILLFCFVNVAYDTDRFSILNHHCTHGAMNPTWSLCIILLIWYWTQFSSISFEHFHLYSQGTCVPAKLLQSGLTLCDPMHCSPPGFTVHGFLRARVLE